MNTYSTDISTCIQRYHVNRIISNNVEEFFNAIRIARKFGFPLVSIGIHKKRKDQLISAAKLLMVVNRVFDHTYMTNIDHLLQKELFGVKEDTDMLLIDAERLVDVVNSCRVVFEQDLILGLKHN